MNNSTPIKDSIGYRDVRSCYDPIKTIFETLLLKKGWKQQDLADILSIDKANISRIVHGLYIPDLNLRLRIAKALESDSALIWRTCDLYHIREIMAKQNRRGKK